MAEVQKRKLAEEIVSNGQDVIGKAARDIATFGRTVRGRAEVIVGAAEDQPLLLVVDVPALEQRQAVTEVVTGSVGVNEDAPGSVSPGQSPIGDTEQVTYGTTPDETT